MAYTPQTWADLPVTTTPVSASRLAHMETGIDEAHDNAAAASTAVTTRCLPAGDLGGTASSPIVARINGVAVSGTPTAGQVPTATSTTTCTWQNTPGAGALDGLTDVTSPTPANDDLLQRKAGAWVNRTIAQVKVDLGTFNQDTTGSAAAVGGVAITGTPTAGQVPTALTGTSATWQNPAAGGATSLDGLTDVTSPSPANDDLLQRKAGIWVNRTIAQFKVDLGTLNQDTTGNAAKVGGITVTGVPGIGQVLTATSTTAATWQTGAAGGLSFTDNNNGTGDLTGGTFIDNGNGTATV